MSMKNLTKVNIHGIEVDFNWFDMENRERYKVANDKLQEKLAKLDAGLAEDPTPEQEIEHFKKICEACHDLFRDLFGDIITQKIFKKKYDYFACMDAIACLINAKEVQAGVIESMAASPKLNADIN